MLSFPYYLLHKILILDIPKLNLLQVTFGNNGYIGSFALEILTVLLRIGKY